MKARSSPVRRFVDAMVDLGGRRPLLVIAWATAVLIACWSYARKLEVRSDIMELLHFGAVALCSYTTVIGYGSLLFADNQALQSFGRFAIGGEIACFVAAVLFLPSLLHLIGAHTAGKTARWPDVRASAAAASSVAPARMTTSKR